MIQKEKKVWEARRDDKQRKCHQVLTEQQHNNKVNVKKKKETEIEPKSWANVMYHLGSTEQTFKAFQGPCIDQEVKDID